MLYSTKSLQIARTTAIIASFAEWVELVNGRLNVDKRWNNELEFKQLTGRDIVDIQCSVRVDAFTTLS